MTKEQFQAWVEQQTSEAPRTGNDIPLIGYDELDLQYAEGAALISALADIIEATCVTAIATPAKAA